MLFGSPFLYLLNIYFSHIAVEKQWHVINKTLSTKLFGGGASLMRKKKRINPEKNWKFVTEQI
jgi:hypothetical protein